MANLAYLRYYQEFIPLVARNPKMKMIEMKSVKLDIVHIYPKISFHSLFGNLILTLVPLTLKRKPNTAIPSSFAR